MSIVHQAESFGINTAKNIYILDTAVKASNSSWLPFWERKSSLVVTHAEIELGFAVGRLKHKPVSGFLRPRGNLVGVVLGSKPPGRLLLII